MTGAFLVETLEGLCNDSSLADNSEVVERFGARLVVGDGNGGLRFLFPNARNDRRAVESSAEKAAAAFD